MSVSEPWQGGDVVARDHEGADTLNDKWFRAADACRRDERHWPADCLIEAVDVVRALRQELAEIRSLFDDGDLDDTEGFAPPTTIECVRALKANHDSLGDELEAARRERDAYRSGLMAASKWLGAYRGALADTPENRERVTRAMLESISAATPGQASAVLAALRSVAEGPAEPAPTDDLEAYIAKTVAEDPDFQVAIDKAEQDYAGVAVGEQPARQACADTCYRNYCTYVGACVREIAGLSPEGGAGQ